jgi:hypothetical protein
VSKNKIVRTKTAVSTPVSQGVCMSECREVKESKDPSAIGYRYVRMCWRRRIHVWLSIDPKPQLVASKRFALVTMTVTSNYWQERKWNVFWQWPKPLWWLVVCCSESEFCISDLTFFPESVWEQAVGCWEEENYVAGSFITCTFYQKESVARMEMRNLFTICVSKYWREETTWKT